MDYKQINHQMYFFIFILFIGLTEIVEKLKKIKKKHALLLIFLMEPVSYQLVAKQKIYQYINIKYTKN